MYCAQAARSLSCSYNRLNIFQKIGGYAIRAACAPFDFPFGSFTVEFDSLAWNFFLGAFAIFIFKSDAPQLLTCDSSCNARVTFPSCRAISINGGKLFCAFKCR